MAKLSLAVSLAALLTLGFVSNASATFTPQQIAVAECLFKGQQLLFLQTLKWAWKVHALDGHTCPLIAALIRTANGPLPKYISNILLAVKATPPADRQAVLKAMLELKNVVDEIKKAHGNAKTSTLELTPEEVRVVREGALKVERAIAVVVGKGTRVAVGGSSPIGQPVPEIPNWEVEGSVGWKISN